MSANLQPKSLLVQAVLLEQIVWKRTNQLFKERFPQYSFPYRVPPEQRSPDAQVFEQRRVRLNNNLDKRVERRSKMRLSQAELVLTLQELQSFGVSTEAAHQLADELLLAYIAEPAVTDVFGELDRWYA